MYLGLDLEVDADGPCYNSARRVKITNRLLFEKLIILEIELATYVCPEVYSIVIVSALILAH